MGNQYRYADAGSLSVPQDAYPISPDDGANLPRPVRGIRAAGAGNVVCITGSGETRTLAFLAGETRYIYVTKVFATDTSATGLEGLV